MNFINNEDKELPLIVGGFLPIIPKKYYSEIDVTKTFLRYSSWKWSLSY